MSFNLGFKGLPGVEGAFLTKLRRALSRSTLGLVVGNPAGGDKGAGTINADALYIGGALRSPTTIGASCVMNPHAANSTQTQAHGLGAAPTKIECYIECLAAEGGYCIGDRIPFGATWGDGGVNRFAVTYDATNVSIITRSTAATLTVINKSTRADFTATSANWKVVVVPKLDA